MMIHDLGKRGHLDGVFGFVALVFCTILVVSNSKIISRVQHLMLFRVCWNHVRNYFGVSSTWLYLQNNFGHFWTKLIQILALMNDHVWLFAGIFCEFVLDNGAPEDTPK